jgi:S-methylmethionine-dependent homocysteine/selenocysteine methylase
MKKILDSKDLILIEASVVERLRRSGNVQLHPRLVHAQLIYDSRGRRELNEIYQSYIDIASKAALPLIICTPTWRANHERVLESGVSMNVNSDAVEFVKQLRENQTGTQAPIIVGGLIGNKNDCYKHEEGLPVEASEEFHSWQVEELAKAGPDFLIAETIPTVQEAAGIARAMEATDLPYIIGFVINRNGCVLDGTPLHEAVGTVDGAVKTSPLGFMVNCAHPSFLCVSKQPSRLFDRLIGYQANASSLDHADLEGAEEVHADSISEWGDMMLSLNRKNGIKILGGCCGTGVDHLSYLANRGA